MHALSPHESPIEIFFNFLKFHWAYCDIRCRKFVAPTFTVVYGSVCNYSKLSTLSSKKALVETDCSSHPGLKFVD